MYCVNDIHKEIEHVRAKAQRYGWTIYRISAERNWTLDREPDLFPADEARILDCAKKAMDVNCGENCKLAYKPHVMLQIGEHSYCKLCTAMYNGMGGKK